MSTNPTTDYQFLCKGAYTLGYDVLDYRFQNIVQTVEVPAFTRLIFGPYASNYPFGWPWIDNSDNYTCDYDFQKRTLTPAIASSLASSALFAPSATSPLSTIGKYKLWNDPNYDPSGTEPDHDYAWHMANRKPKCDCGAAKCNTTHAFWCSTKK